MGIQGLPSEFCWSTVILVEGVKDPLLKLLKKKPQSTSIGLHWGEEDKVLMKNTRGLAWLKFWLITLLSSKSLSDFTSAV